jgi:hypothetical protein
MGGKNPGLDHAPLAADLQVVPVHSRRKEEGFLKFVASIRKGPLFAELSAFDVAVAASSNGNDLILTIGSNGDRLQIDGLLSSNFFGVQGVQFGAPSTPAIVLGVRSS